MSGLQVVGDLALTGGAFLVEVAAVIGLALHLDGPRRLDHEDGPDRQPGADQLLPDRDPRPSTSHPPQGEQGT